MSGSTADRLNASGTVTLASANLNIVTTANLSQTVLVLIRNTGPAAVQNTFLNLPEGFVVTVPNSKSFLMTYAYDAQTSQFDNNGQDVALKVLNTTYYVDPGSLGSDNNNGTSTSSPFATISDRAYQQAGADQQDGAGDTIILRGGPTGYSARVVPRPQP